MKKKIYAWLSGVCAAVLFDALWYLPDVRVYEGLDWRIEMFAYAVTAAPMIYFGRLAFYDD